MNSTTKIIAGVAVLALLFAGIGYAVAGTYTASTDSSENTVGTAYIVLNDGTVGGTKMIGDGSNIKFNTETAAETGVVTYKAQASALEDGTLVIKNKNVNADKVTIVITADGIVNSERFTMTATTTSSVDASGSGLVWTLTDVPITPGDDDGEDTEITITFSVKAGAVFSATDVSTLKNTGVAFTIEATATESA